MALPGPDWHRRMYNCFEKQRTRQQVQHREPPVSGECVDLPGNEDDDDRDFPLWLLLVIPVVSAVVGYGTNVIALKMSFYPVEFTGIKLWQPVNQPFGLFGWQGIVPSRARVMASRLAELFLDHLLDLEEMFSKIDPEVVRQQCEPAVKGLTERIVKETMDLIVPSLYETLYSQTKKELERTVANQSAEMVSILMNETQTRILELLDLQSLVGRLAEENKALVVSMFLDVGKKEYKFVELSGLWFGFLFGCVQALIYYFYDAWWILPLAGLFVGWFTNFLAIKLIFEPTNPIHVCGFTVQGVFLKRQQEASVSIAELSQSSFLTVEHMMHEIVSGDGAQLFREMLHSITRQHIARVMEGIGGLLSFLFLSPKFSADLERVLVAIAFEEMQNILSLSYSHIEEALDLKETLRTKLQALPPEDFVGTLRPVFQEDEVKLIVVGAILGMLVGFLQQFLVFHWI